MGLGWWGFFPLLLKLGAMGEAVIFVISSAGLAWVAISSHLGSSNPSCAGVRLFGWFLVCPGDREREGKALAGKRAEFFGERALALNLPS